MYFYNVRSCKDIGKSVVWLDRNKNKIVDGTKLIYIRISCFIQRTCVCVYLYMLCDYVLI